MTPLCSLPAALLLVIWWKKGRLHWKDTLPLLPFFVLGLGLGLLTTWVERYNVGAHGADWSLTLAQRFLIASRAVWFYADKLIWPVDLIFSYPRWNVDPGVWWQWLFLLAAAGVVVVLWLARHRVGRGPLMAVLFFAGTLGPALGFINVYPMRYSFVADHFQYLAAIGLIALAAAGITIAFERRQSRRFLQAAFCGALLLILGTLTWRQCRTYANQETLWRTTIQRNPNSWLARNNLAAIFFQAGDADNAIVQWQKSLELEPNDPVVWHNLGAALLEKGQIEKAISCFQEALKKNPNDVEACNNLGYAFVLKGRYSDAINCYQKAIQIRPDFPSPYHNLGLVFAKMGEWDKAIENYQKAIQIDPNYASVHTHLGYALQQEGKRDEAIQEYQQALRLNPEDSMASQQLHQLE